MALRKPRENLGFWCRYGSQNSLDAKTDGLGNRNNVTGAAIDALGTPNNMTGTVIDTPAPVDLNTSSAGGSSRRPSRNDNGNGAE
jgi:hypothetical protein